MSDEVKEPGNVPRRRENADSHPNVIPREARRFQGMRAGIVSRALAGGIDFLVIFLTTVGGYLTVAGLRFLWNPATFRFPSPPFWLLIVIGTVALVFYLAVSWWSTGRTYGDHVFGLRVVNHRGERMRLGGALLRALFCAVFPLGLLWVAVSAKNRSVQDVVLRTAVIYDWEIHPADPRA